MNEQELWTQILSHGSLPLLAVVWYLRELGKQARRLNRNLETLLEERGKPLPILPESEKSVRVRIPRASTSGTVDDKTQT